MKRVISTIDFLSEFVGKLVSWLVPLVVAAVAYEIIMRYVLRLPTLWANEIMIFMCGLVYVLGAAWVLKEGKHVKIDILYERLSLRQRAVMDSVTFVFFAIYMGMMAWATGKYALKSVRIGETTGSAWDPAIYPIKSALFIGVILLLLQGLANFLRNLHFAIKGEQL